MTAAKGDLVRLTSGEQIRQARVVETSAGLRVDGILLREDGVPSDPGWSLEIVERYAEPLPTEPGLYLDVEGDPWRIPEGGSELVLMTPETSRTMEEPWISNPKRYAPFRKVEGGK